MIQLCWNAVIRPSKVSSVYNTETSGISADTKTKLKSILDEYSSVFSKKLGKLVGFKAKLNVKENPVPKFMKARPVPYALKESVSKEIERLEEEGILQPISFSDWASYSPRDKNGN